MRSFEDAVGQMSREVVSAGDFQSAIRAVGHRAQVAVEQLEPGERASMADHFVRNLKSLSVQQATELERQLLMQLDATPDGTWSTRLEGAVSLVELRSHLKQSLTGLGLNWDRLTRAQSLVAGVARWFQTLRGPTIEVASSTNSVSIHLTAKDQYLTPELVRQSPLVQMLSAQSAGFEVNKEDVTVEISFRFRRA